MANNPTPHSSPTPPRKNSLQRFTRRHRNTVMTTAPTSPERRLPVREPALELAHLIAFIIASLCLAVAREVCKNPLLIAQIGPFWRFVDSAISLVTRLMAIHAAGELPHPSAARRPPAISGRSRPISITPAASAAAAMPPRAPSRTAVTTRPNPSPALAHHTARRPLPRRRSPPPPLQMARRRFIEGPGYGSFARLICYDIVSNLKTKRRRCLAMPCPPPQ